MTTLLFPGRHLLTTAFQDQYLRQIVQMPLAQLSWVGEPPTAALGPIDQVVFAITSSNQAHSRYNPIPFHVRAIGVDRFARPLEMTFAIRYRIIGIPHYPPSPRFAHITLKEIEQASEGELVLTPANCVVMCSTEAVIQQYQALGFAILPAERHSPDPTAEPPIELVRQLVASGENWFNDPTLRHKLSSATIDLWQDFPDIPRRIWRLWRDPLLTEAGDLTESRDYNSYAYGMSNNAIINLKYQDIATAVAPGKIVDEGCADGALLALIARDFPDSDLIGIEITGEFLARCQERQRAGDFGGSFVHFHQRNITQPLFLPGSIDTTLCNSTTHELWSYGEQAATLHHYLRLKYEQTAVHGRLLIRDVVGPENGEQEVYLWLDDTDGRHTEADLWAEFPTAAALQTHLDQLSTYGRFRRFARDFLAADRAHGHRSAATAITYREEVRDGRRYAILPLRAACEFMAKKDYTDNWYSEMHEEFCFWSFSDWKAALQEVGFTVLENPNQPTSGSRAYVNPWVVQNRWEGRLALFQQGTEDGRLLPLPWPVTNVVLVAQK